MCTYLEILPQDPELFRKSLLEAYQEAKENTKTSLRLCEQELSPAYHFFEAFTEIECLTDTLPKWILMHPKDYLRVRKHSRDILDPETQADARLCGIRGTIDGATIVINREYEEGTTLVIAGDGTAISSDD